MTGGIAAPTLNTLGARLRAERKRLELSQQDAAAACGLSREQWGRCERGAMPGAKTLSAARRMGFDLNFVLGEDGLAGFDSKAARRPASIHSPIFDRELAARSFREHLRAANQSITSWAHQRGLSPDVVHSVLGGANRGYTGYGRQVLLALGWPMPPAMPQRRQRLRVRRSPKPHLKLHIDGRIEPVGARARA